MKKAHVYGKDKEFEYEILEDVTVKLFDVLDKFDEGGIILYSPCENSEYVELLGWVKYQKGLTDEEIKTSISVNEFLPFNKELKLLRVKPPRFDLKAEKGYWEIQHVVNALPNRKEETKELLPIAQDIKEWFDRTNYSEVCEYLSNRVRGQEDIAYLAAEVYIYLKGIAQGKQIHNNVILAAPSGCGKTEVYRALRDYFKEEIPDLVVAQVDISAITEAGYRGSEPESVIYPLLDKKNQNGVGIIFLDEFDKKILPSRTSSGVNMNAAVQGQLLTLIEGCEKVYTKGSGIHKEEIHCNTGNTMFIACGAFDEIRKKKTKIDKQMGFNRKENELNTDHFVEISKEDMVEHGATYELLGRFSTVLNFQKLTAEVIDEIIDRIVQRISEELEFEINISEEYRESLHDKANSKLGCRGLESKIREDVMRDYVRQISVVEGMYEYIKRTIEL